MARWLPYAILVACTPVDAVLDEGNAPPPTVVFATDAVIAPVVRAPQPPRPSLPSGFLSSVSGPEDVDYIVTTDGGGGVRLWPTLDGSREPVIIPSRGTVMAEAIGDGDGIAIATLDSVGELEIIRTTRDGAVIERTSVALPRPVVAVAPAAHAFIAMQDDQRFDAIDVHGASRGEVTPDPGARVLRMVQRNGHVVALLDGKHPRVRAFELDEHGLAWGVVTPRFALDNQLRIALSPDGTRLAGTRDHRVVVIELATGKQVAVEGDSELDGSPPAATVFVDDKTLRFTDDQYMYEWKLGESAHSQKNMMPFAHVTAHALVWIQNEEVIVFANDKPQYLGYHMAQVSDLVAVGKGWIGTDGSQVCRFDARLMVDRMYSQPREQPFTGITITLIDAEHVVLAGYGKPTLVYHLGSTTEPVPLTTRANRFQFARSTGIASVESDHAIEFRKWNPKTATFGDAIAELDRDGMQDLQLYDPAESGLLAAYITMPQPDYNIDVTTVTKLEPIKSRTHTAASTKPFSGSQSFFTNLGRFLPPNPARAMSADGTLVAELLDGRITLRDREGNERWVRTARGATGLAWNADDQLVAYGQGVAYVDLETGNFVGARCGWRFALWEKPSFLPQAGAGMCESDE